MALDGVCWLPGGYVESAVASLVCSSLDHCPWTNGGQSLVVECAVDMAISGSVLDEVAGPDVVWTLWPEMHAGPIVQPKPPFLPLPLWDLKPFTPPLAIALGPMADSIARRSTRLWFTHQPALFSKPVTMRYP